MNTPLIEAIARAMDATCGYAGDDNVRRAEAALTAITEAGYAVVPVIPTDEMIYQLREAKSRCSPSPSMYWAVMIRAAQGEG